MAPLALRERHHWALGGTTRPLPAAGMDLALVRWRRRWSAGAIHARLRRGTVVTPEQAGDLDRLLEAYRRSDLVLAVGGAFGDAFAQHGCGMLDTLPAPIQMTAGASWEANLVLPGGLGANPRPQSFMKTTAAKVTRLRDDMASRRHAH